MVALLALTGSASAQVAVIHSISFAKSCASPTNIGDPYRCSYTVQNDLDEAHDTLTVTGLADVVHSAAGDVPSGSILGSVQITVAGGATCAGGSGNGTVGTPYTGVTSCTLPFGSQLNILTISHYTVQAADFGLPNHELKDDASLTWHDLCNGTADPNCLANPPDAGASSKTVVQQLTSSTSTNIHNSAHQTVTAVDVGTAVHDFVTVTGQPGYQIPGGNVTVEWFLNRGCSGAPEASTTAGPLDGAGQLDVTGFSFTVNSPTLRSFRATYLGDATYSGSVGACESLSIGGATAVQVVSLKAIRRPAGVVVRWWMGSEVGVLGYSVYRERKGARIRLNRAIVPARSGVGGKSYSYLDRAAPRAHGLRYWLQIVNADGSRLWKVARTR